jgi:hypothetical protein
MGGSGMIVQVDESKFSKRKYNVGRFVKSVWVIGGLMKEGKHFLWKYYQGQKK